MTQLDRLIARQSNYEATAREEHKIAHELDNAELFDEADEHRAIASMFEEWAYDLDAAILDLELEKQW